MRSVPGLCLALLVAATAFARPAAAQDPMQLCVNQCMFNHGPAGSAAYDACIRQVCEAGAAAPASPAPPARWTVQSAGGGHSAAVEAGGRSLNVICRRGGPVLIGVAGLRVGGDGLGLRIDRQRYDLPAVVQNGIAYTEGMPHLLAALMAGAQVEATGAGGVRAVFPLTGSGAAIREALRACGVQP